METWVGIDISKDTFDAAWVVEGKKNHLKLENNPKGYRKLLSEVPDGAHFAMEATVPGFCSKKTSPYPC